MGSWKKSKKKQCGISWPLAFELLIALTTPIDSAVSKALPMHWHCIGSGIAQEVQSPW
jgi:hypothetical protein